MSTSDQGQRIERQLRRLLDKHDFHRLELYRRVSVALRMRRSEDRPTTETRAGSETGTALRSQQTRSGPVVFSAASGSSDATLDWISERVSRPAHGSSAVTTDWTPGEAVERRDVDSERRLPSPAEMSSWLDSAVERLQSGRSLQAVESWAEVAATQESWATSDGLRASRTRSRAWAMARCRAEPVSPALGRPLLIAARRWQDLNEAAWSGLLEDRMIATSRTARIPQARLPVLLNPESSAGLVAALVGSLHSEEAHRGLAVGRGWRVRDEPGAELALFGGSFDDAGFPTAGTELADGSTVVGTLGGRGHYRRPSFRNVPVAAASNLIVEPEAVALPRQVLLVNQLSVHTPLEGGLMLAIEGALLRDGEPVGAVRRGIVATQPADLVSRCVGGIGPPRTSYRGVVTPALLFADLDVRTESTS